MHVKIILCQSRRKNITNIFWYIQTQASYCENKTRSLDFEEKKDTFFAEVCMYVLCLRGKPSEAKACLIYFPLPVCEFVCRMYVVCMSYVCPKRFLLIAEKTTGPILANYTSKRPQWKVVVHRPKKLQKIAKMRPEIAKMRKKRRLQISEMVGPIFAKRMSKKFYSNAEK